MSSKIQIILAIQCIFSLQQDYVSILFKKYIFVYVKVNEFHLIFLAASRNIKFRLRYITSLWWIYTNLTFWIEIIQWYCNLWRCICRTLSKCKQMIGILVLLSLYRVIYTEPFMWCILNILREKKMFSLVFSRFTLLFFETVFIASYCRFT